MIWLLDFLLNMIKLSIINTDDDKLKRTWWYICAIFNTFKSTASEWKKKKLNDIRNEKDDATNRNKTKKNKLPRLWKYLQRIGENLRDLLSTLFFFQTVQASFIVSHHECRASFSIFRMRRWRKKPVKLCIRALVYEYILVREDE